MKKLKNEELNRPSLIEYKSLDKLPIVIVLDNIRSLNNIGSIFRTVDSFRFEKIFLCGITATPPHREIHKTALGATESVSWEYYEDTVSCIQMLRSKHYRIIAIEQATLSKNLDEFKFSGADKYALILGNEIKGVSDDVIEIIDDCIEIPQEGTKHSLNVSISGGIVMWEAYRQFREA
jgi:tRNA G18 (ribose-2'-O)-methylase SpoU